MSSPSIFTITAKTLAANLTLLGACSLLMSCQTNLAGKSLASIKSMTSKILPSRVPIAEVRNKDLKQMASGADRALAWDRKLNRWVYMAVDYKPATLPDMQTLPVDGGLLPALHPGQNTTLQGQGRSPAE